jgi:uncharacterized protein
MLSNESTRYRMHPLLGVLLALLLAFFGFLMGGVIGIYACLPFSGMSEGELFRAIAKVELHPELQYVLFASQAGATLLGLLYAPYLWLKIQRLSVKDVFGATGHNLTYYVLAVVIVAVSMGALSAVVYWNQNIQLPESYQWLEQLARTYEERAEVQTGVLTNMDSVGAFLVALFVIAVLPALGEEFLFRGIIQNELHRGANNIHVAIWFAAFLFSFIHLQFFGFFPRMLLGVLFGYLYHWSGNLWVPITAHFANNGLQVFMLYLYQQGAFDYDIDKIERAPTSYVIISGALTTILLVYFYRQYVKTKTTVHQP